MSIFDRIHERIDLVEHVRKSGVRLKRAGQYWKGCCPFHEEKTPSFTIKAGEGKYRCFGCDAHGDVIDFEMALHRLDTGDAINKLCESYGIERERNQPQPQFKRWYDLLEKATRLFHNSLLNSRHARAAREYLVSRGISESDIRDWQLGYAPGGNNLCKYLQENGYRAYDLKAVGLMSEKGNDSFFNRIMFPIRDNKGRVVGFSARTLETSGAKYINSPDTPLFKKSQLLYGLHQAKAAIRERDEVIVVEGYTDVIAARRSGYSNVVAQMGTSLSDAQLESLSMAKRLILSLDGDRAGRAAVERFLDNLSIERDICLIFLKDNLDVDSAIRAGTFDAALKNAISALDYVVEKTIQSVPETASTMERSRIAQQAIPLLMKLESDIARATGVQNLANALNLDVHSLLQEAHRHIPKAVSKPPQKTGSPTIEASLTGAFLYDESLFHDVCERLTWIGEAAVSAEDFTDYKHLMVQYLKALEGIQAPETLIRETLGEDALPDSRPLESDLIFRYVCRLRAKRVMAEIRSAVHREDFETVQALNSRKRKLLQSSKLANA